MRFLRLFPLLLLLLCAPARAEEQHPSYVLVKGAMGGMLSEELLTAAFAEARAQEPNPEHVVVMMHGYWNTAEDSTSSYQQISERIRAQFAQRNARVVVFGLQWESAVPGGEVPWKTEEAYLKMLGRGRGVGRITGRQLIFRIQKAYPKARYHIFAHSMGCEVAGGCVFPDFDYKDDIPKTKPLNPQQDLPISVLCLAGSDLDFDVWKKSKINLRNRPRLLWLTISSFTDERDRTLYLRKVSRGTSGGLALPGMTEQQLDSVFTRRAMVLDQEDIPETHEFAKYYDDKRVGKLADSAISLANPRAKKPEELGELDLVMGMPNKLSPALLKMLENRNLGTAFCALWRVEKLVCKGSSHLSDGTIHDVTQLLRTTPKQVWEVQRGSKCVSIQRGYWPPERMMEAAGAPAWSRPKP